MVPHVHLLDRTPAAPRVVTDDGGMAAVAKDTDAMALDGVHMDRAAERITHADLLEGM